MKKYFYILLMAALIVPLFSGAALIKGYRQARWVCSGDTSYTNQGGTSSCKTLVAWKNSAKQSCTKLNRFKAWRPCLINSKKVSSGGTGAKDNTSAFGGVNTAGNGSVKITPISSSIAIDNGNNGEAIKSRFSIKVTNDKQIGICVPKEDGFSSVVVSDNIALVQRPEYFSSGETTVTSLASSSPDQVCKVTGRTGFALPKGTERTIEINSVFLTKEMLAGTYYGQLNGLNFYHAEDGVATFWSRQDFDTRTTSTVEVGSGTSPFITSATTTRTGVYDLIHVTGVRFSSLNNQVEIGATDSYTAISNDGLNIEFQVPRGKYNGCQSLRVTNSGQKSNSVEICFGNSNNAACGSNDIPTTIITGQTQRVFVDVANTDNSRWSAADGYGLGEVDDSDGSIWGVSRVKQVCKEEMAADCLNPNYASKLVELKPENYVHQAGYPDTKSWFRFVFDLKAPATPGVYSGDRSAKFRMLKEGVSWFGAKCGPESITVLEGQQSGNPFVLTSPAADDPITAWYKDSVQTISWFDTAAPATTQYNIYVRPVGGTEEKINASPLSLTTQSWHAGHRLDGSYFTGEVEMRVCRADTSAKCTGYTKFMIGVQQTTAFYHQQVANLLTAIRALLK